MNASRSPASLGPFALLIGLIFWIVLLLIAAAFSVYIYPSAPLFMMIGCLLEAIIMLCICAIPIFLAGWGGDSGGFIFMLLLSVPIMAFFNGYMLYLAAAWQIEIHPVLLSILRKPGDVLGAIFSFIVNFIRDLVAALTGFQLPTLAPRPSEVTVRPAGVAGVLPPVINWLMSQVWAIILGVISSVLFAIFWKSKK